MCKKIGEESRKTHDKPQRKLMKVQKKKTMKIQGKLMKNEVVTNF
jgi:hypothetical protein